MPLAHCFWETKHWLVHFRRSSSRASPNWPITSWEELIHNLLLLVEIEYCTTRGRTNWNAPQQCSRRTLIFPTMHLWNSQQLNLVHIFYQNKANTASNSTKRFLRGATRTRPGDTIETWHKFYEVSSCWWSNGENPQNPHLGYYLYKCIFLRLSLEGGNSGPQFETEGVPARDYTEHELRLITKPKKLGDGCLSTELSEEQTSESTPLSFTLGNRVNQCFLVTLSTVSKFYVKFKYWFKKIRT